MQPSADIVIIGASTAYHLAQQGVGNIAIVEMGQPGSGSTSKSASMLSLLRNCGWGGVGIILAPVAGQLLAEVVSQGYACQPSRLHHSVLGVLQLNGKTACTRVAASPHHLQRKRQRSLHLGHALGRERRD